MMDIYGTPHKSLSQAFLTQGMLTKIGHTQIFPSSAIQQMLIVLVPTHISFSLVAVVGNAPTLTYASCPSLLVALSYQLSPLSLCLRQVVADR